jgi:hypothetical protein
VVDLRISPQIERHLPTKDTGENSLRFRSRPKTRQFSDRQMPSVLRKNEIRVSPTIRSRRLGE